MQNKKFEDILLYITLVIATGFLIANLPTSFSNTLTSVLSTSSTSKPVTSEPAPLPEFIFTDIPSTHQFANAFLFLKNNSIMTGYTDGSFKPNNHINRAEFIKTLANVENGSEIRALNLRNCFNDVHDEWFAPPVCYAKSRGWIKGYSDNTFRPGTDINRAEALKIFVNTFDVELTNTSPDSDVSDFDSKQWYTPFVWTAEDSGFINDWNLTSQTGGLSPEDMATPIDRLDTATTAFNLTQLDNYPDEFVCEYEPLKGEGESDSTAHDTYPPKSSYEIERTGMTIINQDAFGQRTCFPTTSAMSFTWLKNQGAYGNLVPQDSSGKNDISKMIEELKKDMEWNETEGVNSAQAATGLAKYIKDHGLAGSFTIEFITKAPKNKGFVKHDALEGKTDLDGVGFDFQRRGIKGSDVVEQMKKGQDVIIGIRSHVIEIAGIDETPNENGNYDVKLADPALGKTLGAEITPDGKLKVGDRLTGIQDLVAVSPKK